MQPKFGNNKNDTLWQHLQSKNKNEYLFVSFCVWKQCSDMNAEMLNILKFGDIHVVNEVLMYEFEGGRSTGGIIHISKTYNPSSFSVIFPWYPFTNACLKILGSNLFFKNLDYFIKLNFEGFVSQFIDMTRLFIKKFIGKK